MVELQIVVLAVAGSSPVGHPISFYILDFRFVGRETLLAEGSSTIKNLESEASWCL